MDGSIEVPKPRYVIWVTNLYVHFSENLAQNFSQNIKNATKPSKFNSYRKSIKHKIILSNYFLTLELPFFSQL